MPAGRPTRYSEELANSILEATATSCKSLKTICQENNIGVRTVLDWLSDNQEFSQKYAICKQEQADLLAEEILEIADDSRNDTIETEKFGPIENKEWVNRSKLRVDARKWLASKLKPKKYGDKIDINHSGEIKTVSETTPFEIAKRTRKED